MHEISDDILRIIRNALQEDVRTGDATTLSTISDDLRTTGTFIAKQDGVIAGLTIAEAVFKELDPKTDLSFKSADGDRVERGAEVGSVSGRAQVILTAERTALNILQRMSGIATLTRAFVDVVAGTKAIILDTRKTAPGLRPLDRLAVRIGGGTNHRFGLFDMVLIKDNHIDAAGGISAAVERVRTGRFSKLSIEVECRTLQDVEEAVRLSVDRIMLDNMDLATVRNAVASVKNRIPLEVSGNVSLDNVRQIAETGVQFISVGALTHSAKALDISLKLKIAKGIQ